MTERRHPHNLPYHKKVLALAAESECSALHFNAQEACEIRTALHEMGHPQPPTPIQVDNSTAAGIANNSVKQKWSKAMDMCFYWIQDQIKQNHFRVFWNRGNTNLGDYFTKHHLKSHHPTVLPTYLHVQAHYARAFTHHFSQLQQGMQARVC